MENFYKNNTVTLQSRQSQRCCKKGKTWLIPKNAKNPEDPRHIRKNNYEIEKVEESYQH